MAKILFFKNGISLAIQKFNFFINLRTILYSKTFKDIG